MAVKDIFTHFKPMKACFNTHEEDYILLMMVWGLGHPQEIQNTHSKVLKYLFMGVTYRHVFYTHKSVTLFSML